MDNVSVQCDSCEQIVEPEPPKGKLKYKLAGALVLGFIGFIMGTAMGFVTAGVGFVGYVVTIPVGLIFGWMLGGKVAEIRSGITCPNCGNDFSRSAEQLKKAGAAASKAREGASNAANSARDAVDERRSDSSEN
jgi:hypothetical protein